MRHRLLLVALLTSVAGAASAQQAPAGCASALHRQFDFWAGNWTVTDSAGRVPYGQNTISIEEQGCLLHEHWTGSRGGTGQSVNFHSTSTKQWTQVWVGSDGTTLHLEGGLRGASMELQGAGLGSKGELTVERITWTPLPDGRVRQVWRQSTDGGTTWTVSFDGWYARQR